HIVPLYDYWREPNAAYLIMRLLRGGNLAIPLQGGPIPLAAAQRMLKQIGLALHAAHKQGVVHRDVKPANILLDETQNAYLADFGIAKHLELNHDKTPGREEVYIGSPAYVSPEQIRSEPVRPFSDIYCFGLLLYEMLTGQKPFQGPTPVAYLQQQLNEPVPLLQEIVPDLPPALDLVVQQATAKAPEERFQDMAVLLEALEPILQTALTDLQPIVVGETAVPILSTQEIAALENPYRGLRAFGETDAANFFGREMLVQELLSKLSDGSDLERFLAVVGPSGSGKSSVVKAGLIPALRRGGLPDSENWFITDLTPGTNPWTETATALNRVATRPLNDMPTLLQTDNRGLLRAVRHILPDDGQTELLLVIDQFEELFTLVEDEAVRAHFLESLVTAVLDPTSRLRVVITLRADFTDRPLQYIDFGELMQQRTAFVLPLTPDELIQAITHPVLNLGLEMEPELIATIIQDVGDQPGM
ncbi:MAG: serine/threonine-protein kinase PknK, partial [Anaerolineales bacterium]|nr:serine/threonine-protein kinase PknK [Anaerolineales bacterium]